MVAILAKYFTDDEFRCKGDNDENISIYGRGCGCNFSLPPDGMDAKLLELLDKLREVVGVPLSPSCGFRCEIHNSDVGGVSNSQHLYGIAVDLPVPDGLTVDELANWAEYVGFDGIGRYYSDNFVHVDTRGYKARWEES